MKRIQEKWKEYERRCVPDHVSDGLREKLRDTFFLGVMTLYDMQMKVTGTQEEKLEAGTALMKDVAMELMEFEKGIAQQIEEMRKGRH